MFEDMDTIVNDFYNEADEFIDTRKLKTKELIAMADHCTIAHAYGDGTYLYDLSVNGKAYSVRVSATDFNRIRK